MIETEEGPVDAADDAVDGAAKIEMGPLLELAVADLGLIDRLRIKLDPGLNVLTGETGAGKSLIIDALGLALGARADVGLVRHGATTARVEALFDRLPEPLIVIREVSATGRSTARMDDESVTAARLADVTGRLVEVHGQHDQGRLLDERWQRDLLDAYGGHAEARAAVLAAVGSWRENRRRLSALNIDERELARRIDLLDSEAADIAAARLRVGEADELRARLEAARHGAAIAAGGALVGEALDGDDGSARMAVGAALREARTLARIDPRLDPVVERLAGVDAELEDLGSEVRSILGELDHDAASQTSFEERLSVIYALERRYGVDEAAVIEHGARAATEAEELRGLDGERERRSAQDARLLVEVAKVATVLGDLRRLAAIRLSAETDAALQNLGFPADTFTVAVGRRTAGTDEPAVEIDGDAVAFDATGADDVIFLLAPNAGEPARPLARIASGGELSRVALAIKEVLAAVDATPARVGRSADVGGFALDRPRAQRGLARRARPGNAAAHGTRRTACAPVGPSAGWRAAPTAVLRHAGLRGLDAAPARRVVLARGIPCIANARERAGVTVTAGAQRGRLGGVPRTGGPRPDRARWPDRRLVD